MTRPDNNTPPATDTPGPTNTGPDNTGPSNTGTTTGDRHTQPTTLTPHTFNRELDRVEQSLASLRHNGTHAIRELHHRITNTIHASTHSDITVTTSRGDSIVERAAGNILAMTEQLNDLNEHVRALHDVIRHAHTLCKPFVPELDYTDLDKQRCIGTGDNRGATCTQWADPDKHGRCLDCHRHVEARRQRQWRHRHDTNRR